MKLFINILILLILFILITHINEKFNNKKNNNTMAPSDNTNNNNTNNTNEISDDKMNIMCKKFMNKPDIFILKLNFQQIKNKIQPAIWSNDEFCVYRMEPIISINKSHNSNNLYDTYYHSLGDVILFKNYNKFFTKPVKANMFCNLPIQKLNLQENNDSPAPSVLENFTNHPGNILKDNKLDNYKQPGIRGLRLFVKQGKKPVSFTLNSILKGNDSIDLYIWEPIPPKDFVALGCYCTLNKNPPDVEKCTMRCIPKKCVKDLNISPNDIIQSNGINPPYGIYLVGSGRYFKGITLLEGQELPILKSYEIHEDSQDVEVTPQEYEKNYLIQLKFINNIENSKDTIIDNNIGEAVKDKFTNCLLNNKDFRLNNSRNVKLFEDETLVNTRFIIESGINNNNVILNLRLSSPGNGYEEIDNDLIRTILLTRYMNKYKVELNIDSVNYNFILKGVEAPNIDDKNEPSGYNNFKDPQLEKNTEEIQSILRGRFNSDNELDDFITVNLDKTNYL
uniref:Uncharacterized protein n=1 Tax=Mimiviridae sp. ChoanoV1 TaxID=2596887 RepID=A0A5B8IF17_9VIRU|nr:hypothetical protein 2_30 [Mimiviridae sp. ChoanoV1]